MDTKEKKLRLVIAGFAIGSWEVTIQNKKTGDILYWLRNPQGYSFNRANPYFHQTSTPYPSEEEIVNYAWSALEWENEWKQMYEKRQQKQNSKSNYKTTDMGDRMETVFVG